MNTQPQLTVWFDGSCPLCRREIAHYRRLDPPGSGLRWQDLTAPDAPWAAHGLDHESAMRRLHVLDDAGGRYLGVPAFVQIWLRLPAYRWLARLLQALRLTTPLDRLYARFADWRYQRRCRDGLCTPPARR
ncbi:MAG: thiol-disulfide oxidoreductase DCC family protein [Gammaproteobacteria bacterium]